MPTVQAFHRNMILGFLNSRNLKYLIDSDGDYRVMFSRDDETGCELSVCLIVGGRQEEIYSVLVMSDKEFTRAQWSECLLLCNQWNKEKRWPKAYLHVKDMNTDQTGTIRLEEQLDLEQGIHQELLDDFTETVLAASFAFWQWLHQEKGL